MTKRTVTFKFDPREYPELARWLDSLPKGERSGAIREALLSHAKRRRDSVTLEDVYVKLQQLEARLETGRIGPSNGKNRPAIEVPEDVRAALMNLGA